MRRCQPPTSSRFFFQAEDGIRDVAVTGVQTCALPISRPGGAKMASDGKAGAGRSVGTPVEHGLVGLVLIGKIDRLILAWREVHVAEHLAAAWTLAFHMNHEGGAFALLAQDRAQAEDGIDVAARNRHA